MATYSSDILTGGTPSADSVYSAGYEADKAVNNDLGTLWNSAIGTFPFWWKYDLGEGITKAVEKLRIYSWATALNGYVKDFVLSGSNDDTTYYTVYTGQCADLGVSKAWQDFTFVNGSLYRYYKITFSNSWQGVAAMSVGELEMMYDTLRSFSSLSPMWFM